MSLTSRRRRANVDHAVDAVFQWQLAAAYAGCSVAELMRRYIAERIAKMLPTSPAPRR